MKTEKTYNYSCGIIPVRETPTGWQFLLLRSYNYWDFPKGLKEKGEDPWSAAVRELKEETGIDKIETRWGRTIIETEPYSNSKIAVYFLAAVPIDHAVVFLPNPQTGIIEHHEFSWLPYEESRKKLVPRVQNVIDWARKKMIF